MPLGDAQRTWFPEMVARLRSEWREGLSMPALIGLRDELDGTLQRIQCHQCASDSYRDRPRCQPLPQCLCLRFLAGLCPEKRVSGGKVLSCKTRKVKSRAALALPMGANSLCRAKGYFGEFFRRMRAKLGTAQAITATAHKIARILYHVLLNKEPYTESIFHLCDEQARFRAEIRLRKQAAQLGFQVVPIPAVPGM
jgi:hypothetical protein